MDIPNRTITAAGIPGEATKIILRFLNNKALDARVRLLKHASTTCENLCLFAIGVMKKLFAPDNCN